MNKHTDCEDCCQLKEVKGYDTCQRAGHCQWLEDEIARLIPKAETGEQWAHICKLEADLNGGPFFAAS